MPAMTGPQWTAMRILTFLFSSAWRPLSRSVLGDCLNSQRFVISCSKLSSEMNFETVLQNVYLWTASAI